VDLLLNDSFLLKQLIALHEANNSDFLSLLDLSNAVGLLLNDSILLKQLVAPPKANDNDFPSSLDLPFPVRVNGYLFVPCT
jgi:hypothetical protein